MIRRSRLPPSLGALFVGGMLLAAAAPAVAQRGSVLSDVPAHPRAGARYLIYLHARIVEEKGRQPADERFGVYEYPQILDTLAASGFEVISEQRPARTDFHAFGVHVAGQVRRLLAAGVPPERISVVGFSKGGAIAIVAAALLRDARISYVLLAPCGDWVKGRDDVDVRGRILSIYEASDELGTSCEPLFAQASHPGEHREIRIATGLGHGAFFRPRSEWLTPLLGWLRGHRRTTGRRGSITARSRGTPPSGGASHHSAHWHAPPATATKEGQSAAMRPETARELHRQRLVRRARRFRPLVEVHSPFHSPRSRGSF